MENKERKLEYAEVIKVSNYSFVKRRELLPMNDKEPKWVDFLLINVASGNWQIKMYEFSPMYQYIVYMYETGAMDAILNIFHNMHSVCEMPDPFYQEAVTILSAVALNPILMREGSEVMGMTHESIVEMIKRLKEAWLRAYDKEMDLLKENAYEYAYDKEDEVAEEVKEHLGISE